MTTKRKEARRRESAQERDERRVRDYGWSWGTSVQGVSTFTALSEEQRKANEAAARILNRLAKRKPLKKGK